MTAAPADRHRVRRTGRAVLWLVGLVVLVATWPLFVAPASDDAASIGPVDAVVVLGGAPEERLDAAVELATTLATPPPVVALAVQYQAPVIRCGSLPALPTVELRCFSPRPATTAGEAVWIGRQAAAERWQRIAVVTSDFHVTRTRLLVERCRESLAPASVVTYHTADTDETSVRGVWSILTEWPSLLGTPLDHEPACRGR